MSDEEEWERQIRNDRTLELLNEKTYNISFLDKGDCIKIYFRDNDDNLIHIKYVDKLYYFDKCFGKYVEGDNTLFYSVQKIMMRQLKLKQLGI